MNNNITKKYFITAKIFEALGFLLGIYALSIYIPTLIMLMPIDGEYCICSKLWTWEHLGWVLVSPLYLLIWVGEFLNNYAIVVYIFYGIVVIGCLILMCGIGVLIWEGFKKWIDWNRGNLK
jgi:hypothetical protein